MNNQKVGGNSGRLKIYKWIKDNSLSLLFFGLFVGAFVGQSISGLSSFNDKLRSHGRSAVGYVQYLSTGDFLDGVFTNWQAAILQLGSLILFARIFHQKGASHSRKPEEDSKGKQPHEDRRSPWIYRHSLSLAFTALFCISFAGHIVCGSMDYNETRALTGEPPVSIGSYFLTGNFWFKTTQTWQAEFIAIGLFIVLSIYLREEGSAESKPVESSDQQTGETNK